MELRYHSDASSFYDAEGHLYPEPIESLDILEAKHAEVCKKLESLPLSKPACEYSADDDDMLFDLGMARFNLCSLIENLEWKVDLKLLHSNECVYEANEGRAIKDIARRMADCN